MMMTRMRIGIVCSVIAVASLVVAVPCMAESTGAADKAKVNVTVWVIRATKSNTEISPKLKSLAKKLKKSFNFTGYKLLKTDEKEVALDTAIRTKLAKAYSANITPTELTDKKVKLSVAITQRKDDKDVKKLNTTVNLTKKRFQLFGGWKLDGEDVLIVAISAY